MCGNDSTYVCKPHMEIELWPHLKLCMIYSPTHTHTPKTKICKLLTLSESAHFLANYLVKCSNA